MLGHLELLNHVRASIKRCCLLQLQDTELSDGIGPAMKKIGLHGLKGFND